jgi:hypothetical protein
MVVVGLKQRMNFDACSRSAFHSPRQRASFREPGLERRGHAGMTDEDVNDHQRGAGVLPRACDIPDAMPEIPANICISTEITARSLLFRLCVRHRLKAATVI